MTDLARRILVVDVPESVQIERVMDRDDVDEKQARRILDAQASRDQRLAVATEVIDNSGDLASLEERVDALHQKYLRLAAD